MKVFLIVFLVLSVLFCGCTADMQSARTAVGEGIKDGGASAHPGDVQEEELGPSVDEYFGQPVGTYYTKSVDYIMECIEGECPDKIPLNKYLEPKECFFCGVSSEVYDDRLVVRVTPMNFVDTLANCVDEGYYSYPDELEIIDNSRDKLVAKGSGAGSVYHHGSGCGDGEYKYSYEIEEIWIFTSGELDNATVKAESDGGLNRFSGPVLANPNYGNPPYSEVGLTVTCTSPDGFNVKPTYKVIKKDGAEFDGGLMYRIDKSSEDLDGVARFTFASYEIGEYTIVAGCGTYGRPTVYGNEEFTVVISGPPVGTQR